jgi:hypothetical protein
MVTEADLKASTTNSRQPAAKFKARHSGGKEAEAVAIIANLKKRRQV